MGPIINFWVINLKKAMANKHQEFVFHNGYTYKDEVLRSKTTSHLTSCNNFDLYESAIKAALAEEVIENAISFKWIKFNGIKHKSGYLIKFNSIFYQIEWIILNTNDIWFLCRYFYKRKELDIFFNSFLLERYEECQIIKFDDSIHSIFEKMCLHEKNYIIAKDLSLLHDI